jgi:hypothetical protein
MSGSPLFYIFMRTYFVVYLTKTKQNHEFIKYDILDTYYTERPPPFSTPTSQHENVGMKISLFVKLYSKIIGKLAGLQSQCIVHHCNILRRFNFATISHCLYRSVKSYRCFKRDNTMNNIDLENTLT